MSITVAAAAEMRETPMVTASENITLNIGDQVIQVATRGELSYVPRVAFYAEDGVPLDHIKSGHKPELADCSTCNSTQLRHAPHRRLDAIPETQLGELSGDLGGKVPRSKRGNTWFFAAIRRSTRMPMVTFLPNKTSLALTEAVKDLRLDMKRWWRLHGDKDRSFLGHLEDLLRRLGIVQSDTGGYDPQANGLAENLIRRLVQGAAAFLHQAGAQVDQWDEAMNHFCDILCRLETGVEGLGKIIPLRLELVEAHGEELGNKLFEREKGYLHWPPWGCKCFYYLHKEERSHKFSGTGKFGMFLGFDSDSGGADHRDHVRDGRGENSGRRRCRRDHGAVHRGQVPPPG